jgi:hypothetical protein
MDEHRLKMNTHVQMCTTWSGSASSTIRQVQAVCEMRHRLLNTAASRK